MNVPLVAAGLVLAGSFLLGLGVLIWLEELIGTGWAMFAAFVLLWFLSMVVRELWQMES